MQSYNLFRTLTRRFVSLLVEQKVQFLCFDENPSLTPSSVEYPSVNPVSNFVDPIISLSPFQKQAAFHYLINSTTHYLYHHIVFVCLPYLSSAICAANIILRHEYAESNILTDC